MSALAHAEEIARQRCARVVFPETDDPRVAEAARLLADRGLARPVPVVDCGPHHIDAVVGQRPDRPMRPGVAARLLERPLMRAAAMLTTGEADIMVAGAALPTKRVIEAASIVVGLRDGLQTPSSFFVMVLPDGREFLWADCAVNVDPDAHALADIARASQASAQRLLGRGQVAFLSYSTGQSGAGPSVAKVAQAASVTGFDGPVQADAALNAVIARQKGKMGDGGANVLVFPNLDAGNIAYKLLVELAGARAYGPILQGFRRPICDLSRGATVDDIVASTVLAIACDQG